MTSHSRKRPMRLFGILFSFILLCVASPARASENVSFHANEPVLEVLSDSTVSFKVRGKSSSIVGRTILDLVNEERQRVGVPQLEWDMELEKTALQRAAEIAIYYSHTRPDNSMCFAIFPPACVALGENIAASQPSPEEAFASWKSSPEHYKNMIDKGYTMMGAALFVGHSNENYWVQVFASGYRPSGATKDGIGEPRTYTIVSTTDKLMPSLIDSKTTVSIDPATGTVTKRSYRYRPGETRVLTMVSDQDGTGADIDRRSITWMSDDPSVAVVDSQGNVTGVSNGSTTIRARLAGNAALEATSPINVSGSPVDLTAGLDLTSEGWVSLSNGGEGYGKGYVKNGALTRGWLDLGAAKYYFKDNGVMSKGWTDVDVNGKTMHYYFNPASGNLVRDTWFTIEGVNYYFRPSGNLATGWATIKDGGVDKKYYFEADGSLVKDCWRDIDNGQGSVGHYYFRPSGAMATEWATIGGRNYFFRPSGNMATGWADVTNDSGVTAKHYFDEGGVMLVGWQTIGGNTYYFRPSGAMQTGAATIDGTSYTFSDKGVLVG